jgi:hypothetical protein
LEICIEGARQALGDIQKGDSTGTYIFGEEARLALRDNILVRGTANVVEARCQGE